MTQYQQPSFLKGTFAWTYLGYFFAERPPIDLLAPTVLSSADPWLIVAAVLEHAKRTNHSHIPRMSAYCEFNGGQGFEIAAMQLIGDAGRETDLSILQAALEYGSDSTRAHAANAASMTGRLWLVPFMLEAWKCVTSRDHHEIIGNAISLLLEAPGGLIAQHAGSYNLDPNILTRLKNPEMLEMTKQRIAKQTATDFEMQVLTRFDELRKQFDEHTVLWEGEPFSVSRLAKKMYALVSDPAAGPLHGLFIPMRHKFEATTGINCSGCYRNGVLQPLNATAILEVFLDSNASTQYEDGVRYFFSHRIPE
ncbi:hypothetical protein [Pseudomonas chlororaphis]|uniref:Uncharacterized protein n=1 Tax=Pseudomonas chlororaphis TaxID=587753 RepID=A0AAX3FQ28_9PSED|nr:hypothetical protein [Pseudomonas chlororaphis]AVO59676.1 hypothetical protein C6Q18_17490 [Pseudomonas chlororaphis subsp. piscium]AZC38111.1 hypothetical protein C4K37_3726 [Pseudomonas chlororaphis subsp. piscium]AZC44657.1 hypothetical protein C4K36_3734 [Pseudomonas chlororaphis subsp. piscium]AZC76598.1 hypothetical protein C4K31_3697 [Pseudomonas chlororaphis subsp. piscium]WDG70273.1 hypothetical protein PUP65_19365 [Pseudomonas chlororaphis]